MKTKETTPFLTIYHNIFLSKKDRNILYKEPNSIVKTYGASVPVWCWTNALKIASNEPAKEIFCKYLITNRKNLPIIFICDDGYQINLPSRKLCRLLQDKPKGKGEVAFQHYSFADIGNERYKAIHFIVVKSEESFIESSSLRTISER